MNPNPTSLLTLVKLGRDMPELNFKGKYEFPYPTMSCLELIGAAGDRIKVIHLSMTPFLPLTVP